MRIANFRQIANQGASSIEVNANQSGLVAKGTSPGGKLVQWFRGKTDDAGVTQTGTTAKQAFLSAIKKEYGIGAFNIASRQMGGSRRLNSGTVTQVLNQLDSAKTDLIKSHNNQVSQELTKQFKAVLDDRFYQLGDAFEKATGMQLPKLTSKLAKEIESNIRSSILSSAVSRPLENDLNSVFSNLDSMMIGLAFKERLRSGADDLMKTELATVAKSSQLLGKVCKAIVEIGETEPSRMPEMKKVANKVLAEAILQQGNFEDASRLGLKPDGYTGGSDLIRCCGTLIEHGFIDLGDPKAAKYFDAEASAFTGKMPAMELKLMCASERCREIGKDTVAAGKVLENINQSLNDFVKARNGQKPLAFPPNAQTDRQALHKIRSNTTGVSLSDTSTKLGDFVVNIYKECMAEFGVDEDSQTMIMYGSGSRNEMFLFSDLEFAVMTDKNEETTPGTPLHNALAYFEMRMIALGETPRGVESQVPIHEGMCFDPGGNTPMANDNFFGTSDRLLKIFQNKDLDLVQKEVFSSARLLCGKKDRFDLYAQGVDNHFKTQGQNGKTLGQQFALTNLADQFQSLKTENSPVISGKLENRTVDAKRLMRFPVFIASALGKYHGLSSSMGNTVERLEALEKMGVLSKTELKALVDAFNGFAKLRLKAEGHYGGQVHKLWVGDDPPEGGCVLSQQEKLDLENLLQPLPEIYQKALDFITNDNSPFRKAVQN